MVRSRAVTLLLSLFVFGAVAQPKTIRVPQDQPTIQGAINAAANGDTVLVDEGTYVENLQLNKKLVLGSRYLLDRDTSHISRTVIDGSSPRQPDSASVINLGTDTDTTTVIAGLTIRGGKGTISLSSDNVWWRRGGGINSSRGGSARIVKNIIAGNALVTGVSPSVGTIRFHFGAGLAFWPTGPYASSIFSVIIEDNIIRMNSIQGTVAEAGGIVVANYVARIEGNVIEDNSATAPANNFAIGGISIGGIQGTVVDLRRNIIRRNFSTLDAGGIAIYSNSVGSGPLLTMSNNLIVKNIAARYGGGIVVAEHTTVVLLSNTVADNVGISSGMEILGPNVDLATVVGINNIFWNPASHPFEIGSLRFGSFHHNLIRGESTFGDNNFSADPQFLPDGSYRLSASSPCFGAGALTQTALGFNMSAPSSDLQGNPRPRGAGSMPDLGAIEEDQSTVNQVPGNRNEVRKFTFAGADRYYVVVRPKGLETATRLPVLMQLHGYGGTAIGEIAATRMHSFADSIGFMMVYPEAFQGMWNSGIGDNWKWPTPAVDDVRYFSDLIDTLHAQFAIDTSRVYVMGLSNGGFMVQRLAAFLSHRIRGGIAISSVLSMSNNISSALSRPVPMMIVNGTSDPVIPYGGGTAGWLGAPETVDFWRLKDQATTMIDSTTLDADPNDGTTVERYKYHGGRAGQTVWFYKVNGGGHTWPGCPPFPYAGTISREVDIRSEILDFITDVTVGIENQASVAVPGSFELEQNFPNPFNPETRIGYRMKERGDVELSVMNILGQRVAVLVDGVREAGYHEAVFSREYGVERLPSGVYFYRISVRTESGHRFETTKRMMMIK